MTRQNGTQLLSYEIYHRTYGSGVWTEGTGVTNTSATNGGVLYRMANNATAQAFSFPYYMQNSHATGNSACRYLRRSGRHRDHTPEHGSRQRYRRRTGSDQLRGECEYSAFVLFQHQPRHHWS